MMEALLLSFAAYVVVAIVGALFGSFANVCIHRLPPSEEHPRGQSIAWPGSMCPACGAPVRFYDNLPIVSYIVLRGRCRQCAAEIAPRYLFVEATCAMLFLALYHVVVGLGASGTAVPMRALEFVIYAAFTVVLVVIAFIDLEHKLILNKVTYPAIPIFYGLGLLLPDPDVWRGIIGAAVGYGLIRLIADGYYFVTKREGMGYGDGKLLAMVGALLGVKGVIATLFLGSIFGSVIGITALLIARRGAPADDDVPLGRVEIPFGPFLAMGAMTFILAQSWLIPAWL